MKTKVFTLCLSVLLGLFSYNEGTAQLKLIHYWDFNSTQPAGGGGGVQVSPLAAEWSTIGGAYLVFDNSQTTAASCDCKVRDSILDNGSQGTGINARAVLGNDTASSSANNLFVRTRNPSHNMNFLWYIPTTGYKNIVLTYATESSSAGSGQLYQIYSYSLDSGLTYQTANLPIDTTQMATLLNFTQVQLNLSAISGANNNRKFVFRITFGDKFENDTINKGNNRFDNITVEGDTTAPNGINVTSAGHGGYSIYPNPAKNVLTITGNYQGTKLVKVYNLVGQQVSGVTFEPKQTSLDLSTLAAGVYFINITELKTGNSETLKFVKN